MATKFGHVDRLGSGYSGGTLNNDFSVARRPQWSPYQARLGDATERRSLFEYCNKEPKRLYRGPNANDPLKDYTLSGLCQALLLAAQNCGVDTFFHAPDYEGNVWDMSTNYTRISFAEAKAYIDHCLAPEPAPILDALGVETPASALSRAQVFDEQAHEDSSHLWNIIVSHIDESILFGLRARLASYGNRGPGLLLFFALVDDVTSGSAQVMVDIHSKFQNLKLSDYPGENVRLLIEDVQTTYNLMAGGGSIHQTASTILVNKFLSCSTEGFRSAFHVLSGEIDIQEKRLIGKDNAAMLRFQSTDLGVNALCNIALRNYKRLLDNGRWIAGLNLPKSQPDSLPAAFQASSDAAYQAIVAELKSLRNSIKPGTAVPDDSVTLKLSNRICFHCGKKGHMRNNFPSPTKWTHLPPPAGAPTTIFRHNTNFYWCTKCKRWVKTHTDATHIARDPNTVAISPTVKFTEDTKSPTAKLACETVSQNENNALVPQFTSFGFIATCDDSHVTWSVDNNLSLIVNNDFISPLGHNTHADALCWTGGTVPDLSNSTTITMSSSDPHLTDSHFLVPLTLSIDLSLNPTTPTTPFATSPMNPSNCSPKVGAPCFF